MPGIVISYRREDSAPTAGRVADHLINHFGPESVFMDIDSIPLGKDFREQLRTTLDRCDVLLAIIGPSWLKGLKEETDWVRLEIETAMARKIIPIIPVLIDNTQMPSKRALPESIQDFAYYNAATLNTDADFRHHMQRLIRAIDHYVKMAATKANAPPRTEAPVLQRPQSPPSDVLKQGLPIQALQELEKWTVAKSTVVSRPEKFSDAAATTEGKSQEKPQAGPLIKFAILVAMLFAVVGFVIFTAWVLWDLPLVVGLPGTLVCAASTWFLHWAGDRYGA